MKRVEASFRVPGSSRAALTFHPRGGQIVSFGLTFKKDDPVKRGKNGFENRPFFSKKRQ